MGSMGERLDAVDNDYIQSMISVRVQTVKKVGPRSTDTLHIVLQAYTVHCYFTTHINHITPTRGHKEELREQDHPVAPAYAISIEDAPP